MAASIAASCASVGVSVMVISPVCVVIVPAKADTRSSAVPVRFKLGSTKTIAPVVALLIAFNCATV